MHVVWAWGQGEETKRRAAAMMLTRTGRDRDPPLGRVHTIAGWRAPWGCAAGAPYRGTASPPPPRCPILAHTSLGFFLQLTVAKCAQVWGSRRPFGQFLKGENHQKWVVAGGLGAPKIEL